MRLGWYISGAGHGALVLLVLFGGLFMRDRMPEVTVSEVSIISEAEFAALTMPRTAPEIATETQEVAPPVEDAVPQTPAEDSAPATVEPETVETPDAPEPTPETLPEPLPDAAIVEDDAPVIDTPETEIDGSSPLPDAVAQPAPRVADTPTIAPPPLTEVAPEVVPDTAPEPAEDPVVEPEPEIEPAAPEEASDRIVTEAEETKELAPATSMRPRTRPAPPVRQAVETPVETLRDIPVEAPATDPAADAIAAAVAAANDTAADAPSGPPLTGGEKDAFRIAVGRCWVVDPGARSAGVTVTVGFSLDRTGKVSGGVRQVSASGGDAVTQRTAFESARRAILRCGAQGFDLPEDKYAQWRDVEITFNPEGMRVK